MAQGPELAALLFLCTHGIATLFRNNCCLPAAPNRRELPSLPGAHLRAIAALRAAAAVRLCTIPARAGGAGSTRPISCGVRGRCLGAVGRWGGTSRASAIGGRPTSGTGVPAPTSCLPCRSIPGLSSRAGHVRGQAQHRATGGSCQAGEYGPEQELPHPKGHTTEAKGRASSGAALRPCSRHAGSRLPLVTGCNCNEWCRGSAPRSRPTTGSLFLPLVDC